MIVQAYYISFNIQAVRKIYCSGYNWWAQGNYTDMFLVYFSDPAREGLGALQLNPPNITSHNLEINLLWLWCISKLFTGTLALRDQEVQHLVLDTQINWNIIWCIFDLVFTLCRNVYIGKEGVPLVNKWICSACVCIYASTKPWRSHYFCYTVWLLGA